MRHGLFLSLPVVLALAGLSLADEIRFPGGRRALQDVEIISETYEEVVYKITGSNQKEPAANIAEINRTIGKNTRYKTAEQKKEKGDWKGALADFGTVATSDKLKDEERWMKAYSLFNMAECHKALGQSQEAIAVYGQVLELEPKAFRYAAIKLGVGDCKIAMGDKAGARAAFQELEADAKSKKLGDRWANEANFRLAELAETDGKDAESLERYRKVAQVSAGQKGNAAQRASINVSRLTAKTDPAKAEFAAGELEKLVANENQKPQPDSEVLAAASNALGDVYAAKGDHKKALLAYLRVALDEELRKVQAERPKALFGAIQSFEKAKTDDWKNRAEQLKAELKAQYPSSPWAKKVG